VRRRLTVAVLAVVVGTLVLTVAGGLVLVRRAALGSAESELTTQAAALRGLIQRAPADRIDAQVLDLLRRVGSYDTLRPVGLAPDGTFTGLPAPLTKRVVDVAALQADEIVTGNVGQHVFVATPLTLTQAQGLSLGIATGDLPVLLVVRTVHNPVNGAPYFLVVAGIVLAVGAVVAAVLARRISAPLRRAVATTTQMAAGAFDARVPVGPGDDPELRELAEAINAMGDALARARGLERQFLLSVSHDLRTPLTSIRGYAEALAEGATDDVAGAAGVITTEARRLERLVQDLLDLARLDARAFSLELAPVDVGAVVRASVDALRPVAREHGIAVDVAAGGGPDVVADAAAPATIVQGDADRLSQVIGNVVENGLRFAASRLDVTVGADTSSVTVAVTDDGPGIPADDLGRVFDRHFSSDRRPGRRLGSGLGLAIVAELTRAMGGDVRAESPVSAAGGTRIVVRLPRAAPSWAAPAAAERR
jgi:two-component system sensor histidine kinase BaeS